MIKSWDGFLCLTKGGVGVLIPPLSSMFGQYFNLSFGKSTRSSFATIFGIPLTQIVYSQVYLFAYSDNLLSSKFDNMNAQGEICSNI
ncbi:MAG: hypothetical protein ACI8PB_002763 [Desulforhopalus sp.]|jgi:hypothetical protein